MRKLIIIGLLALFGCSETELTEKEKVIFHTKEPYWRAVLEVEGGDLPFNFDLFQTEKGYYVELHNDTEKLLVKNVRVEHDSIFIPGYIFESEIQAKIVDGDHLIGKYVRFDTDEKYEIPFYAVYHLNYRFSPDPLPPTVDVNGNWEVTFNHEGELSKALGVFHQDGNHLTGTFMTPTGDYRYLDGEVDRNEIHLSCFDGAHAFLFEATVDSTGMMKGGFWSGKYWEESWEAIRNDSFKLPDADTLTHLKLGFDKFEFNFPESETGEMLSWKDERFKDKVTIIQIMGSWCPNCMDETMFLRDLKNEYPDLEIVGLAFEKTPDFKTAAARVNKVKQKLDANYPFVIAGKSNKREAGKALPMLDHVLSYPTTIMIDKRGEVRNIHTGFTGPGTGEVYTKFTQEYVQMVKKLLNE